MEKCRLEVSNRDESPVIVMNADDVTVTVHFSNEESGGIRDRIREILTESYEEHRMKTMPSLEQK